MENLFNYATKELSQDAFLRWLIENYNCEDEEVVQICQRFLQAFTNLSNLDNKRIEKLKTFSQYKKIDILIRFKYENNVFCIALEDKVFTEEHEQLKKYNQAIEHYATWLKSEYNCDNVIIKKIFYKISNLLYNERKRVEQNGWKVFDINNIYHLIYTKDTPQNIILGNYIEYITRLYLACNEQKKPNSHENHIDWLKWESYFNSTIVPHLSKNGYQVEVKKAGQYPYVCLNIKKQGLYDKTPYLEIRSRDCLNNNFCARILLYSVEKNNNKIEALKQRISQTAFITQNYDQQIGKTPPLKARTNEEFVKLTELYALEFLKIMEKWT